MDNNISTTPRAKRGRKPKGITRLDLTERECLMFDRIADWWQAHGPSEVQRLAEAAVAEAAKEKLRARVKRRQTRAEARPE